MTRSLTDGDMTLLCEKVIPWGKISSEVDTIPCGEKSLEKSPGTRVAIDDAGVVVGKLMGVCWG